ncbi:uncharacterized protein BJ171DRAFT_505990 [Polychytrium aggregatum]|uniref:uncharacterized protein n=1 Tax=Polychytrium aggregatum TaxID=110093 RepID=UPI0022FDCAAB|nr:uncharacterized protein BJ171DRAFT_505990 [Polychytrium aggregatum]KAI9204513.1 hypothetical protein BJ171DRAFT_505990 [Polychytrium aggregatum]
MDDLHDPLEAPPTSINPATPYYNPTTPYFNPTTPSSSYLVSNNPNTPFAHPSAGHPTPGSGGLVVLPTGDGSAAAQPTASSAAIRSRNIFGGASQPLAPSSADADASGLATLASTAAADSSLLDFDFINLLTESLDQLTRPGSESDARDVGRKIAALNDKLLKTHHRILELDGIDLNLSQQADQIERLERVLAKREKQVEVYLNLPIFSKIS